MNLKINADGMLTGATGVTVGSKTYDVSFVDGTCASVFGACTNDRFDFKTLADATLAGQALVDQVFNGDFDNQPGKTSGCEGTSICMSLIVYNYVSERFDWAFSRNANSESGDLVSTGFFYTNTSTSAFNSFNFARFTPSTASTGPAPTPAVPEPATWAMMLLGFGMVGATVRYRRRALATNFG